MKKIFKFLILIIMFFSCNVYAAEYDVSNENELINALTIQAESDVISLKNNINVSGIYTITGNVLINGNGYTLSYDDSYCGIIFNVTGSLELSNLKFNGNNKWSWKNEEDRINPNVFGDSTTLNIGDKKVNSSVIKVTGSLKIDGSNISDYYFDGAKEDINSFINVSGNDSFVVIDSTVIDNLYGTFISAINSKVEFNNNSKIINSFGLGNKGAFFKLNGAELIIKNSSLENNCGLSRSGSLIGAVNNSLITFNNGIIDNNIAKYHGSSSTGSMITLETGAGFVMNGGVISNNVGTLSSVIATRWTNDPDDRGVILNSGLIKNNTTTKTTWLNASVFMRSSLYIGKDMVIEGDVVVNNTNASMENNGTINGKVTLNDKSAKAINNGVIKDLDLLNGEFINNNLINNAYEFDLQIINNGKVTDNYIKELPEAEGKVKVKFDVNDGKDKEEGYSILDKHYDLNYKFSEEDMIEVEREGYIFEGWFTDEEFTNEFKQDVELTENLTIYAKWRKIPEVSVPDTYIEKNILNIMLGMVLLIFGSVMMYLLMSKQNVEQ